MSLADVCVCAEKLEKEIRRVTCKLFTSKLGTEFVFRKIYERKCLCLYAFILLEFSCLCKILVPFSMCCCFVVRLFPFACDQKPHQ